MPVLMTGMLLAGRRRTVTTWLRAAGVGNDYQDDCYFLASVGRNSKKGETHPERAMLLCGISRKPCSLDTGKQRPSPGNLRIGYIPRASRNGWHKQGPKK